MTLVLLIGFGGGANTDANTDANAKENPIGGDRFDTVVLDAGHGGRDRGALGPSGYQEKEVSLTLALALEKKLIERGLTVVMTRREDIYIPLEQRTSIANDARADLFLSIHANASRDSDVDGIETYFLSLKASDEDAQRVADAENMAFETAEERAPVPEDPLFHILGDMIETEHMMESSEFAGMAQTQMGGLEKEHSRGVKQAPFVVLMGVQMPASLLEVGFISNPKEEKKLRNRKHQAKLVEAILVSVDDFGKRYDARRGIR
jgi:N-acetylmuramoyl-L-alanine amidase